MKAGISISAILLAATLLACNNSASKQEDTNKTDSAKTGIENKIVPDTLKRATTSITAQFVDFTQGDASHFIFKDDTGKDWDFGGNEDGVFKFAMELPKNKANETNQGWGPDKKLQGKWFNISYIYRDQPEYPDGPIAKVPIIISVKPKE